MSIYGKDIADTSRTMRAGHRSAVDTGALVGAQYLGFVYGAGVFANGIPLGRIVGFPDISNNVCGVKGFFERSAA
jgi:hypothetical protein